MKPFRYKTVEPGCAYDVFRRCDNWLLGRITWSPRVEDGKLVQRWAVEVAIMGAKAGPVLIRGVTTYGALRRDDLARYLMRHPPGDWPVSEATRRLEDEACH